MSDRITSSEHQADRDTFVQTLSRLTGLDPATVYGWTAAENGPYTDPLGFGYNGTGLPNYQTSQHAAEVTAQAINSGGIWAGLRTSAKVRYGNEQSAIQAQALAISVSPWVTGHARAPDDPGATSYRGNILSNAVKFFVGQETKPTLLPGADALPGFSSVQHAVTGGVQHIPGVQQGEDAVHAVSGGISSVSDFFGWITDSKNLIRIGEIVGGFILLLLGLYLLAKKQMVSMPSPSKGGGGAAAAAE